MGLFSSIGSAAGGLASGGLSFLPQLAGYSGGSGGAFDFMGDLATGGAISNAKSVAMTNEMQMALAQKQMDFQERMSNSAYQRAMEDMRKAGLNPMLAFDKGGASTPSGAMATLQAPKTGDKALGLFNTAKGIATAGMELKQMESQSELNKANAAVADVSAQKITANAKESEANTQYTNKLTQKAEADVQAARARAREAEMDTELKAERFEVDKKMQKFDSYKERLLETVGAVTNGLGALQRGQFGTKTPQWERNYKQWEKNRYGRKSPPTESAPDFERGGPRGAYIP